MKLIVGLGNIGKAYDYTRHNVGFMVIDAYLGDVKYQEKFNAYYYKKEVNGEIAYFVKPKTFMNNSGLAVREFVNYFNIDLDDILVIQDDLDQEFGRYKLKTNSSSGGHNGIKSIISNLGTEEFLRLKIGINNERNNDVIDFVLSKFSKKEINVFNDMCDIYIKIIDSFITSGTTKTMNIYNTKGV